MSSGPSDKDPPLQPPRKPDDLIVHHGKIVPCGEDQRGGEQEHEELRDVPVAQDLAPPDIEVDPLDAEAEGDMHEIDAERDLAQILREADKQRTLQGRVELKRVDGREPAPPVPERVHVVAAPIPPRKRLEIRPRVVQEQERVVAPRLA